MLVFCFALLMLVNKIPGLLSGIITGAGIGHSGIGNFGAGAIAGAAIGAAGMTATAASMAGSAIMGGAQNIAGGISAIKAAFEKAQAGTESGSSQMPSFEYIEVFYNRKRQHSTLGFKSPTQFLENWINEHDQEKQVA